MPWSPATASIAAPTRPHRRWRGPGSTATSSPRSTTRSAICTASDSRRSAAATGSTASFVDLLPDTVTHDTPGVDHELFDALRELTPDQRVAVVLVHMYGFSYREVADVIGASDAAVTNYVHRGLKRLRDVLEREERRRR